MHTVKVFNDSSKIIPAHVEIDGKPLEYCRSIDYHTDVDIVPTFVFEVCALANIEVNHADICFKFHPETVEESVKILRHELMLYGGVYDGLLASIKSALHDLENGIDKEDAAKLILSRIIRE